MHQKRENGLRRNARILLLFLACLALAAGCAGARAEGGENRKLTLMVYLCGSNLESAYGSASADIEEMLAA